mgnify:CR=1 FL=1
MLGTLIAKTKWQHELVSFHTDACFALAFEPTEVFSSTGRRLVRVAIPLFGTRVSPRCLYSEKMLLANVQGKNVVSRKIVETFGMSDEDRLSQLVNLGIEVFVCGAIEEDFIEKASAFGIKVIFNVAAEAEDILSALAGGYLETGFGLSSRAGKEILRVGAILDAERKDAAASQEELKLDCSECIDRPCLENKSCPNEVEDLFLVEEYSSLRHSMEVTTDISAETDRKLCRVAEFIYYCLGMEYKHIGVAFCVEMFQEVEILARLLRRFFQVSTVCCKIGGRTEADLITAVEGICCNPIGQARVLNKLKTEMNAAVGLCVGCDSIFAQHSEAPVSTLFVKDKSLANNPVSALYSKYYINDILREV